MVLLYYRPNQFSSIYEHPSRIPRQPPKPTILSALKPPQTKTHIALLESCIHSGSLDQGRLVHSMIGVDPPDPFVGAKLVSMYCKCGSLEDARAVFESLRVRNIFAWSAMIGGCARDHRWTDVVKLFYRMVGDDGLIPDGLLFPKILQACANSGDVQTGVLLHSLALRKSVSCPSLVHVNNALLAMYAMCGELASARRFFDGMDSHRDHVTWNSIISGYCRCGDHVEAMRMFERMRGEGFDPGVVTWNIVIASCCKRADGPDHALELMEEMVLSGVMPDVVTWTTLISGFTQKDRPMKGLELFREMLCAGAGVRPNGMTIAAALSACASVKALNLGKEIHSFAIKTGSDTNVLVGNSLIDMYAKSGELDSARSVFDEIKESERDVFTWNSIISAYAQNGDCEMAHKLFVEMGGSGVCRNAITWNVMISGYLQNGDEDRAMQHFRVMESDGGIKRNTASWNLLISGVLQHGRKIKALDIFREMQFNDSRPNLVTILSILPACANLVSASKVKEIHCSVLRGGLESELLIMNSLIDTYSKSGDIFSARSVFEGMSFRDVVSWNLLISSYLLHGCPEIALERFELMKEGGVTPNWITLAGVLFAYSHLGKVNEGKNLFSKMMEDHQLIPRLQHFEAMVDLLGRSGRP
ncbi:Pentatricopeptide repeat-containing protein [Acorus calamus]|uniref:Pentatricopeptide repeat-containing protein n=1 Tax=Acorus calamus TaxID=4465 RepID=A0AAV9EME6_ACOCL|nr:Pentatricopeptide repeat-containing protein [Acorus calamus]